MTYLTEDNITDVVVESVSNGDNERLKEVLTAAIRHSHAFVREVGLTHEEWLMGLNFLRDVGQFSDDKRHEFILLSDNLGISSLVDFISDLKKQGATQTTALGPFYIPDQEVLPNGASLIRHGVPGAPLLFEGRVETVDGDPIAGAAVDVWHPHEKGLYDLQEGQVPNMRARLLTEEDGSFRFVSVMPAGYPLPPDGPVRPLLDQVKTHVMRPAHIHLFVTCQGYQPLVTHVFDKNDPHNADDVVYGVREDLIIDFKTVDTLSGEEPDALTEAPYRYGTYTLKLAKAG